MQIIELQFLDQPFYESIQETLTILADQKAMQQLRVSIQEEKDGKSFVDIIGY